VQFGMFTDGDNRPRFGGVLFPGPHLTRVSMIFDVVLLFTPFPVQITFPLARDVIAAVAVYCPKEINHAVNEASSDSFQSTAATWTRASGHFYLGHHDSAPTKCAMKT